MEIKTIIFCKRNINSQIMFWALHNDIKNNNLIVETGTVKEDGLINIKHYTLVLTKKSIDTEIKSLVNLKKRHGYKQMPFSDIQDLVKWYKQLEKDIPQYNTDMDENLQPMKCHLLLELNKLNFPILIQPKLNGFRGVLRYEKVITDKGGLFETETYKWVFRSKSGLIYHLPHITDNFNKIRIDKSIGELTDLVFDGELYIHGKNLNYIESSIPRINANGTLSQSTHSPLAVNFNIFDLAIDCVTNAERKTILTNIIINNDGILENSIFQLKNQCIGIVIGSVHHRISEDQINKVRDYYINNGYEGAIIRSLSAFYSFGQRPSYIQKCKRPEFKYFKIVNVIPKDKEPETAKFVCKNDINDEIFTVNPKGTYEERKEYLDNKENYIGKEAYIRFYERSGKTQVPFHATLFEIKK